jgi:hypothetical protein
MPDIAGTTRAQSIFLRALRENPSLPPEQWPTPFLFRKWLRRPAFRRALSSLRDANRFRSAYHLSRSAADASTILHAYLRNADGYELSAEQVSFLSNLLRLSQSAERLDPSPKPKSSNPLIAESSTLQSLTATHPNLARPLPDPTAPQVAGSQ